MKDLFDRIILWGADKGIHDIEFNSLQQISFLTEELTEICRANSTDEMVGEITDLIVFSVNAICLLDFSNDKSNRFEKIDFKIIVKNQHKFFNKVFGLLKELNKECKKNDVIGICSCYCVLIQYCYSLIITLGYSPEIALLETVKKIESRRGAWDSSIGKWVKEKNQTDIYVPNYSLAKNDK